LFCLVDPGFIHAQFLTSCPGGMLTIVPEPDQDLDFDYLASTLSITGFDCLPCSIGISVYDCRAIKACISDCEALIPEEPEFSQIVDDCIYDCGIEFPNDPNAYYHCLSYCSEMPLQDYQTCLEEEECG